MYVMNRIHSTLFYLTPPILLVLLLYMLTTYDPVKIGAIGVFAVFALIYMLLFYVLYISLRHGRSFINKLLSRMGIFKNRDRRSISRRRAYLLSSVMALMPIFFLAMGSFSSLEIGDVILIGAFVVVALIYTRKSMAD